MIEDRIYPIHRGRTTPPEYRIVQNLSDAELEDEILGRQGDPEYQRALLAEADRRALLGAPNAA